MSNETIEQRLSWLCWLGIHDWFDATPDCIYGWTWTCRRCEKVHVESVTFL